MIEKIIVIMLLLFSSGCHRGSNKGDNLSPTPTQNQFINPVFKPVFADPTLLDNRKVDGYFYAYATQDNWGTDASSEKRVPIIRSKDLVNWEYMGDAFDSQPNWHIGRNLYWAPDVKYRNGKYYMYFALSKWGGSNSAIGVAVSNTPDGKFKDLGKVLDSKGSGVVNSIDPYFFTDTDGRSYLFWGSFHGIYGVPIENDGITVNLNEKFQIAGNAFEASYIYFRNGYYYFFGSVGSCCRGGNSSYRITVARSKSLKGPYMDINGNSIMFAMDWNYGKNDVKNVNALLAGRILIAPGHNSEIVQDDNGQDWILYHAIKRPDYYLPNGATRRPLCLDKVTWDANGWPKIGANGFPSEYETDAPIFK